MYIGYVARGHACCYFAVSSYDMWATLPSQKFICLTPACDTLVHPCLTLANEYTFIQLKIVCKMKYVIPRVVRS